MREVDFRYLRSTLESLSASTDLVLARGYVKVTLSRQCSPYASRRGVAYEQIAPLAPDEVLVAVNLRKILLVGLAAGAVKHATEAIGRAGRPFEDSQLGWDGPHAQWVVERVPVTLPLLHGLLCLSRDYGLVDPDWLRRPLIYTAWLVPYVVGWDDCGRPIFDWPDCHCPSDSESESESEPEPEPVSQDLPVEV